MRIHRQRLPYRNGESSSRKCAAKPVSFWSAIAGLVAQPSPIPRPGLAKAQPLGIPHLQILDDLLSRSLSRRDGGPASRPVLSDVFAAAHFRDSEQISQASRICLPARTLQPGQKKRQGFARNLLAPPPARSRVRSARRAALRIHSAVGLFRVPSLRQSSAVPYLLARIKT